MVRGMVGVFVCHFTRSVIPTANRQTLTHRVESAEHGKPNCLHLSMESNPYGVIYQIREQEILAQSLRDVYLLKNQ